MKNPRIVLILPLAIIGCSVTLALAQTPAPTPAAPPAPAPLAGRAPIAGRVLTLDECIAIALEAQPRIQATLYDYAAARYRVNQAFAPLLPQLTGLVSATRSNIPTVTTNAAGTNITTVQSRQFGDSFIAQVQLSQLLFDFGKNLAATDAARKFAEVAVEDVE